MLKIRLEQANGLQAWCRKLLLGTWMFLDPTCAPFVDVANGIHQQNAFEHRAHFFASTTCESPKPLVSASAEAILVDFEYPIRGHNHSFTVHLLPTSAVIPRCPISSPSTNAIPGILLLK